MNYHSKSQYHDAFAAIVKITLRDGDASDREIIFLEHLMSKLSISLAEYEFIMEHYLKYPISAPYTYEERIYALYELSKILIADRSISGEPEKRWLERMGKAIGFEPSCIEEVVSTALSLVENAADFEKFSNRIRKILNDAQNTI